jgi:hypothetical protein
MYRRWLRFRGGHAIAQFDDFVVIQIDDVVVLIQLGR